MEVIELIKGFLLSPTETFQKVREIEVKESFKYLTVLAAIYSVLTGLLSLAGISQMFGVGLVRIEGIAMIPVVFIGILAAAVIGGAILHIFVYLVGGREGIGQTIKAVIYASTPSLLLGWLPVIGAIAGIWAFILEILGIRELQRLSTGRAVLAVLLPVIIGIIVGVVLAFATLSLLLTGAHISTTY
jgi:hypothetical protein